MIHPQQRELARNKVKQILQSVSIVLTPEETEQIEVADFGLNDLDRVGLQLITYINTDRVCAKELVLFPNQTCPQHYHPSVNGLPGKEETFRCRWGDVYLYVPGDPTPNPKALAPQGLEKYFPLRHEVHLRPGEQYTIPPETPHWFQAGPQGAVVSEFSSKSTDEFDIFVDQRIIRDPNAGE